MVRAIAVTEEESPRDMLHAGQAADESERPLEGQDLPCLRCVRKSRGASRQRTKNIDEGLRGNRGMSRSEIELGSLKSPAHACPMEMSSGDSFMNRGAMENLSVAARILAPALPRTAANQAMDARAEH